MNVSFQHNCGDPNTACTFDTVVILHGEARTLSTIVILLDCSASMRGTPMEIAAIVVRILREKIPESVIICARSIPHIYTGEPEWEVEPLCDFSAAFFAARSYGTTVVFITDGYEACPNDVVAVVVGNGTMCVPHFSISRLEFAHAVMRECVEFLSQITYTGVSVVISAGDGVRILSVIGGVEIIPLKKYRVPIGIMRDKYTIYMTISLREGWENPPVVVEVGEERAELDPEVITECGDLAVEIVRNLGDRADEMMLRRIEAVYPSTPALMGAIAAARGRIAS